METIHGRCLNNVRGRRVAIKRKYYKVKVEVELKALVQTHKRCM